MPESLNPASCAGSQSLPRLSGQRRARHLLADDFREVRVKLPLSLRTRNAVGTIFGGSLYGAVDPIYMIMLMRLLGPG